MKMLLAVFGFSLLMVSSAATSTMKQESRNSQKSQKASADALERVAAAHGKEQLARADMVGEGTVTVYKEKQSTALKVTLLRNAEHQSQRILLQQSGKLWDGRAETLTVEGKRALDFLETQYMRGLRQLLKAKAEAVVATAPALTLQEDDGVETSYFLDSGTSRLSHFDFEQGQQVDPKGRARPNVHSIFFSDYRSADGIATPFRVAHETNGSKQEELQLTTVRYLPANDARKQ